MCAEWRLPCSSHTAFSIASSISELKSENPEMTVSKLIKSGMNIGKDVMGTMTNTLILAYIGSSLSTVLLLTASNHSLVYLFNLEMITVEIIQALVGSIGILTAIPLTSVIAAGLYKHEETKNIMRKLFGAITIYVVLINLYMLVFHLFFQIL